MVCLYTVLSYTTLRDTTDIGGASATFSAASGSVAAGTGQPEEYSIDELRERIEAMENLIREGEDIEGWEDCIESKLLFENYRRKHKDTLASVFDVEPFPSGLPAGSIVDVFNTMYWFTGDNAPLFHYGANEITTARPIPVGVYEVHAQYQKSEWIPCDYVAPPVIWRYTFESAEGVLHEAFFDPVHIDEGVGASNEDGVLRPESFESDDGEIVVEGIKWRDEQLEMELSAATDLADHRMDFIALDGSVSLRLDFDNAIDSEEGSAAKLSWGVCEQPWEDGDMLMIRIASGIPDDGVQATNDSECQTASAE